MWNLILTHIWDTFRFILKFRCDNHHDGIHAITRRSHTLLSSLTHELQSSWLPHTHIYMCAPLKTTQVSKHYISHVSLTLLPLWAPYSSVVKSWPNKSHYEDPLGSCWRRFGRQKSREEPPDGSRSWTVCDLDTEAAPSLRTSGWSAMVQRVVFLAADLDLAF